jgi:protein-S-isoprenylcysteine O-methyltransferase Ste14
MSAGGEDTGGETLIRRPIAMPEPGRLTHLRALLLPFIVTVAVPMTLLLLTGSANPFWRMPFPLNLLTFAAGFVLAAAGIYLLDITIHLFATIGKGTLAPWDPPRRLVVEGPYRYVRNPMHTGVFAILAGEALLTGSIPVTLWTIAFIVVNLVYIPVSEEPGLEDRFGDRYRLYKRNVPRWIPRSTPWSLPADTRESREMDV